MFYLYVICVCHRDGGAPEQLIKVERLELPPPEERMRASVMLDVMEVRRGSVVLYCIVLYCVVY